MRFKCFCTQCTPLHSLILRFFSFNGIRSAHRFRVHEGEGNRRLGRLLMAIFVILFFTSTAIPSVSVSQRRNNAEHATGGAFGGRRFVLRKQCPPPKCCNVVEHVSRTRGGATRELGRALRSSIERGDSLHEAIMKATSNEAMAGVADRSFAEKALEEKAKADLSVAEQRQAKAEEELEQLKQADKRDEDRAEEFEQHRIEKEEEEVKRQKHAAQSLISEEQKLAAALEEELAALEAEVGATEADAEAADAKLEAMVEEALGEESAEEAARKAEEAEAHAEEEKAENERTKATRVAEIAKHITEQTTEELEHAAEATNAEAVAVPKTVESIGELQTKVLSDVEESEKEEQQALSEQEKEEGENDEKEKEENSLTKIEEESETGIDEEDKDEEEKTEPVEETKDLLFLLRHLPAPKPSKPAENGEKETTEEEDIWADLQPLEFPVAATEQRTPEPLEAEPQVDPEEEELPELWFGNKGPEEEKLQADVQNDKEKKWWQYMLA